VPTFAVGAVADRAGPAAGSPRLFWGADALEMLAADLHGDPWFDKGWSEAGRHTGGVQRRR
jgi:hypothetical protein